MSGAERGHVDPGEFARMAEWWLAKAAAAIHVVPEDRDYAYIEACARVGHAYAALAAAGETRELREAHGEQALELRRQLERIEDAL